MTVNCWLLANDIYYLALLPLLIALIFVLLYDLQKSFFLVVFLTPVSIGLRKFFPELPIDMAIPTEPLLLGILLMLLMKSFIGNPFRRSEILHPVTLAIFVHLAWIFISSLTSTIPLVSFKSLLVKLWFFFGIYLLGLIIFRKNSLFQKFIWLYSISMIFVIAYTLNRLTHYGFNNLQAINWIVEPFFDDHTSYGAMLVMFLFPMIASFLVNKEFPLKRILMVVLIIVFSVALIYSHTRAAWISFFIAIGIWIIVQLKIKLRIAVLTGFVVFIAASLLLPNILKTLEENEAESSGKLSEHIQSISNITSDASNMERINRWKCALKMFQEKPIFGWGPGTYMFQYAPFQHSGDRTIISTNFGDRGNAHSEYLGLLAESGIPGLATFLIVLIMVFNTIVRSYRKCENMSTRIFILASALGVASYFVHGVLNNFLDTDKAAVPVWGFIAFLVATDIQYRSKKKSHDYSLKNKLLL